VRIVGEAEPEFLDWLDVKEGEIFCVMGVGCNDTQSHN
jgi:hypothetical protein